MPATSATRADWRWASDFGAILFRSTWQASHASAFNDLLRDFARDCERVTHLSPAYFTYTLSKSVLWTMTRTLAQSLAPRIRVNAIGPGAAIPPPHVSAEYHATSSAELPLGKAAGPDGIADGIMAILSLDSLTGQMLSLDGGEHIEWPARRNPTPRRK